MTVTRVADKLILNIDGLLKGREDTNYIGLEKTR